MLIKCTICAAENDVKGETGERCFNCDNDLPIVARQTSRNGQSERSEGSIYGFFAATYAFIFVVGLGGYLLAMVDSNAQFETNPFLLFLTFIAVTHLVIIKRIDNIAGIYKGSKRYNFPRFVLLYGIVALIVYHIATSNGAGDKNKVFHLIMMMPSLMLFYTYYFGKRRNSFFYAGEAVQRRRGRTQF